MVGVVLVSCVKGWIIVMMSSFVIIVMMLSFVIIGIIVMMSSFVSSCFCGYDKYGLIQLIMLLLTNSSALDFVITTVVSSLSDVTLLFVLTLTLQIVGDSGKVSSAKGSAKGSPPARSLNTDDREEWNGRQSD